MNALELTRVAISEPMQKVIERKLQRFLGSSIRNASRGGILVGAFSVPFT